MNYTIGLLRHDLFGHAEEQIIKNCQERNLDVNILDPFDISIGIRPDDISNKYENLFIDGVISRPEIDNGLAPEAEAYLRLLQFYEKRDIPTINSSQSIITAQDKFRTHSSLAQKNIPTPKTFVTYNYESAERIMKKGHLKFPIIVKDLYGSRGSGVHKVNSFDEMNNLYDNSFKDNYAFMLQEFLNLEKNDENETRDMRIWVKKDEMDISQTIGGVYRNARNGEYRTNAYHQGFVSEISNLETEVKNLSKAALDAVDADVAGVDIGKTIEGKYFVEEINISFDTGPITQGLIGRDIWGEVVDLLISRIEKKNAKIY